MQIRIMFEPSQDSELLQINSLNDHQQQTTWKQASELGYEQTRIQWLSDSEPKTILADEKYT